MSTLVIVESPAKAKTIEKYLGKGFTVKASKGHIVDLPKSGLGVDVEKDFTPEYGVMPGKQKVISELKKAFKDHENLIIASDPDREGEAIGWHVANKLGVIDLNGKHKKNAKPVSRIVFTEITAEAVKNAVANPRQLDLNLLNAQQTRRVLDRLVGYKLSPLLWKKIRFGLSAGRVQSVAVKFIVERELERDKFKPEEYWQILADLSETDSDKNKGGKPVVKMIKNEDLESLPKPKERILRFQLVKVNQKKPTLENAADGENVLKNVSDQPWIIAAVDTKQTKKYPKPPFTTSAMQQAAANIFGFSAKKTMTIAQKLYEGGLITYMRTDSTNLSTQAIEQARSYIAQNYGQNDLPQTPNFYRSKIKVAQEAHEAIRPANFTVDEKHAAFNKLEADAQKLYRLIWQKAMASQMLPAELENIVVLINIQAKAGEFQFKITGQRVIYKGYLKALPEKVSEVELPALEIGQELFLQQLFATQHFTQPPARFSEATLIKELEKYGIGRPSTYAPIISTIQARQYVTKENGYFKATDTAFAVTRLLDKYFNNIVDTDFTADMEDGLDSIANGELNWKDYLHKFYDPFAKDLTKRDKEISRDEFTVIGPAPEDTKCPECGAPMLIKLGRFGRFYSCSRFPDCKGILADPSQTAAAGATLDEDVINKDYEPSPKTEDGREFILKTGRFGQFWAHPDYPKVKDARPLVLKPEKIVELYGNPPKTEDGRKFEFRTGKFGKFWAHPDYPKVKETVAIRPKGKAKKKSK